jgi:feruloyl esterase
MIEVAIALAMAGASDCQSLKGRHAETVVVDDATIVRPAPEWSPTDSATSRGVPVTIPFCRIEGTIEGSIGFELWLPQRWNGRLLGAGVGGPAGVFNYADMSIRLHEGFATLTTDTGHKASETRWMSNAKARVDYEHRGVHLTTVAAKEIVQRHYGRPAARSYYLGCSGGGRQALKEMQNYPSDYDGVVAGAPGPNMPLNSVRMMWFSLEQLRNPDAALTDEDWALYERAVTAACDLDDDVGDGVIENPLACQFDIDRLACTEGQTGNCLSAPKLAMLKRIVAPMLDEAGRPMDRGLVPGVRTRPGPPSPLLRAMWADAVYNDPEWDEETFQRTADLEAANRIMPELRADRTDISAFIEGGGKAILYQGWSDPSTIADPTIDYYAALARDNSGEEQLRDAVRLFMVPGMYHCRGGPGADSFGGSGHLPATTNRPEVDILWSLINWVEEGEAPRQLVATKYGEDGAPVFTRRLCPFPERAVYDGQSDPSSAASYACRRDPTLAHRIAQ